MLKEFKEFAMRGNVIDMAVGIILGTAFGVIIKSLVSDVIMPPVGLIMGNTDFSSLFITLKEGVTPGPYLSPGDAAGAGAVTINYGSFINTVVSFLVVSIAMFFLVRSINRMKRRQEQPQAAPETKECPFCLSAIKIGATRCAFCASDLGSK